MLELTRGGLKPGKLVNCNNQEEVTFMFNPFEYSIAKTNSWEPGDVTGRDVPKIEFKNGGAQTLTLTLFFDTLAQNSSVTTITDKLWKMMMIDSSRVDPNSNKSSPPDVELVWGGKTILRAVITNMTQAYTLFLPTGTPVRCKVTIGLQQRLASDTELAQVDGATSTAAAAGTTASGADRIDNMVSDPNAWRATAAASGVNNPTNIPVGTVLV
jgi:hypothetical protein